MKLSDIPRNPSTTMLRQFAGAWLVFFLLAGAHQYLGRGRHGLGLTLCAMAVALGIPGLIKPALMRWIFVGWMIVVFPIGWVISQVILGVMYFLILAPVALFFRLRGRDLLNRKAAPEKTTYWSPKETPKDVRRYFQQF